MYQLCFYVPASHLELVKSALFESGAGKIGNYGNCCWQTLGQGQFKPLAGSIPFLGEKDQVEIVAEYKVEMICKADKVKQVLTAFLNSHPYETPAYSVYKIHTIDDF